MDTIAVTPEYIALCDAFRAMISSAIAFSLLPEGHTMRDELSATTTTQAHEYMQAFRAVTFDERAKFNFPQWGDADRIAAEVKASYTI